MRVKVIDNPMRTIPAGLNRAIEAAQGEIIVRLDAHSTPYPDYIDNSISALERGLGDNVGGVWEIRPSRQTWIAHAIACAAAHPLAVGDARYRYTDHAQLADTIPFGAFRRSLIERVGMFDESLMTNEDYEFNLRIRLAGGKIWLDPRIHAVCIMPVPHWGVSPANMDVMVIGKPKCPFSPAAEALSIAPQDWP